MPITSRLEARKTEGRPFVVSVNDRYDWILLWLLDTRDLFMSLAQMGAFGALTAPLGPVCKGLQGGRSTQARDTEVDS